MSKIGDHEAACAVVDVKQQMLPPAVGSGDQVCWQVEMACSVAIRRRTPWHVHCRIPISLQLHA